MKNKLFFTLLSACLRAGFCLVLPLSAHVSHGQTVETIELNFSEKDFQIETNKKGVLRIESLDKWSSYSTAIDAPALPYLHYYYLIEDNFAFRDIKVNGPERLIKENAYIVSNPEYLIAGMKADVSKAIEDYSLTDYPQKSVIYTGTHKMGSLNVLSFSVCPFRYDAHNHRLYFIESMKVQLTFSSSSMSKPFEPIDVNQKNYIRSLILNPERLEGQEREGAGLLTSAQYDSENVTYLIITSPGLKNSFQPLVQWKRIKGLKVQVITTDSIYGLYPSLASNQLKIKTFLRDYQSTHGLKYVLLGGDDTVVPVQYCYMEMQVRTESGYTQLQENVPADLYYSCFNGCFDWDGNHNGIYGEFDDDIQLYPSVILTRLPVRTTDQTGDFIEKLIRYEAAPDIDNCRNNMMMAGSGIVAGQTINGHYFSDAQIISDNLYNQIISPLWYGSVDRFFDTDTDFDNGQHYWLTDEHLQEKLSNGYSFINLETHGHETSWQMELGTYGVGAASTLNSPTPALIATCACLSNAFDNSADPSLSEAFIRNPNNNVLTYFGCSRTAFYHGTGLTDGVNDYITHYYSRLFANSDLLNHYGEISLYAKSNLISKCASDTAALWMMYAFNPIGDPEMPVYLKVPEYFKNIKISYINGKLTVAHDVHTFEISAITLADNGETFYYRRRSPYGWSFDFDDLSENVCICLQAPDHIPFVFRFDNGTIYLSNAELLETCQITGAKVVIDSNAINGLPSALIRLDGSTTIKSTQGVEILNNFEVPIGSTLKIITGN